MVVGPYAYASGRSSDGGSSDRSAGAVSSGGAHVVDQVARVAGVIIIIMAEMAVVNVAGYLIRGEAQMVYN